MISIITLAVVFVLIAVRQIGRFKLRIWQIMLGGAAIVLVTGEISPLDAAKAINLDVMLFLFGVFLIGQAMEESGYLGYLAGRLFSRARSLNALVLLILFGMGILSALLLNDTLAIIGTPVVLSLALKTKTPPKILLLALAFAVTIGSVMSPIGNPQNLLVALHDGIPNPFVTFFKYLAVPTLVNLLIAFLALKLFYRKDFRAGAFAGYEEAAIKDVKLAAAARISLALLVILILARIIIVLAGVDMDFRMTYIALAAALPVVFYLPKRPGPILHMDWLTLVFFAAMFVLMQSVWNSGYFQELITSTNIDLTATGMIMGVSIVLSQLLSNVPLVALYLPVLAQVGADTAGMMALAAGSTIAGNLTILGAASNVIIIQNAEKKGQQTLTFWEFVKIGLPLTAVNAAVYWAFFLLF